jgi:DNA-binding NarL/FixJ family response regulator
VADNDSIRVLVGEASKMASQLIAITLKRIRKPRFEIILPSYFTSTAIIDEIVKTKPDVALVSNCLQDGTFAGYTVLRSLQTMNLSSRLILLLEECARTLVIDAFRAGARGIFSRAESTELLSKCISTVYRGQVWAGTRELNYILEELAASRSRRILNAAGQALLSTREEDIVALVADGLTNRQISEQLKLSEHTVKNYLFNVFEKLGVCTRVELVLYALSRGSANGGPTPEFATPPKPPRPSILSARPSSLPPQKLPPFRA